MERTELQVIGSTIVKFRVTKSKNVENANIKTCETIVREAHETFRNHRISSGFKYDISVKHDGNLECRTGGRECRIAVINFSASSINIQFHYILQKASFCSKLYFMLDMDATFNLIEAKSLHFASIETLNP